MDCDILYPTDAISAVQTAGQCGMLPLGGGRPHFTMAPDLFSMPRPCLSLKFQALDFQQLLIHEPLLCEDCGHGTARPFISGGRWGHWGGRNAAMAIGATAQR